MAWVGEFGVQLFFVLSGYLMANLLFLREVRLPDFFARRMARVLPTFIVFVLAMVAYAAVQRVPYYPSGAEILSTLTFLSSYFPADVSIWSGAWANGNLWSLNVEEHSYIFLAGLALIARLAGNRRLTLALLFGSVGAIMFCVLYYPSHPPHAASPWYLRSECAALGLIASAAIRVARGNAGAGIFALPVTLICLFIAALCFSTYEHKGVHITVAPILLAIGINYLASAPKLIRSALSSPVLCKLGTYSFSLYLWQQPFFLAVKTGQIRQWQGLILAAIVGTASFYLLENPARKRLYAGLKPRVAIGEPAPA